MGKFAHTCAAVAAVTDTQSAHALIRSCLGPAKVKYAHRTLPVRHTAAFAADVTATQRARLDAVVGTPTSDAARVQTTGRSAKAAAESPVHPTCRRSRG